ncbi:hypothetical protein AB0K51_11740 [Kitasatospora sp. NPDC049285]|uniref:hypothetical protein n=1 Tax=Kitasatospora sp. NPDC049285 TaxID=3157096 RepID=UPI0034138551
MSRDYYFHREYAGCSVTVGVYLGTARAVELLVDGHEVGREQVAGHHEQVSVLHTTLPTDPPQPVSVEAALPAAMRGDPECTLVAAGERLPMPQRPMPHRARPTEESWYH